MEDTDHTATEPPAKRRRLSATTAKEVGDLKSDVEKEMNCGITSFVHRALPGFVGVLKHRYTDFLVNEILPNGQVLHLRNTIAPKVLRPQESAIIGISNGTKQGDASLKQSHGQVAVSSVAAASVNGTINGHSPLALDTAPNESGPPGVVAQSSDTVTTLPDGAVAEDDQKLKNLLGQDVYDKVAALFQAVLKDPQRKPRDFKTIKSEVVNNKDRRTEIHKTVREIFKSRLETTTADDDTILFSVASQGNVRGRGGRQAAETNPRSRGRPSWDELGGQYLHFTLYKESRDTMESISFLASQLRVQPKGFQFSGTKDRRAVTVQRCSVYRIYAADLAGINKMLRNSRVGDFEYSPTGLELGDLGGNEFVITLRDCHFPSEEGLDHAARLDLANKVVAESVQAFKNGGFLNYYGLQRFGSFAATTDLIGVKLLQGDTAGAVDSILSFNPASLAAREQTEAERDVSRDDIARAESLNIWRRTGNSTAALERMPRKFTAESSIIRYLGARKTNPNDFQGALSSIPRNLRLMYVHAYQSLIWNVMAGRRWELYGDRVVEGDLVLISEHTDPSMSDKAPTHDEQGEPIVQPGAGDRAIRPEEDYERARALTAEEATSGRFSIFDVVLPLPGYDVVYPPNAVGEEYKTFMASERGGGLDPHDMRRSWKDVSLSGGYRKVLARPHPDVSFEVKTYQRPEDQLVTTDLEALEGIRDAREAKDIDATLTPAEQDCTSLENKIAVVLRMKLGASQYATMALRELMKEGNVKPYQGQYTGGR